MAASHADNSALPGRNRAECRAQVREPTTGGHGAGRRILRFVHSTTMRETVSACMIVLNEEMRLPAALESVAFCDEIIVVDACSTDATAPEEPRWSLARRP